MTAFLCALIAAAFTAPAGSADVGGGDTTRLDGLVLETLRKNPEIDAARDQMDVMAGKAGEEGTLPPPELIFMREGMPAFRYRDAMFSRVELMQMIPFPTKLASRREIAEISALHAHHEHAEKALEVLRRLKTTYAELWYVQQSMALGARNSDLLARTLAVVRARFAAGGAGAEDVLRASLESARNTNTLIALRARERALKAMLMSIAGRSGPDTIGCAVLREPRPLEITPDSLVALALSTRPAIEHDSLAVEEERRMLSAAKQEYIPDFRIGLQYMTAPLTGFNGWTVTAGVSIPFAPWSSGATASKIEESEAGVNRAEAMLEASRASLRAEVTDLAARAASEALQADNYRNEILPQSEEALRAALGGYRAGRGVLLPLLDAYRMLNETTLDALMLTMEHAQTIAALEQAVGVIDISALR
ncbi:MAG TPA: TolC family protein [Bacteroidota bacterium]|nr:TolC family protein [Bacteroidota bacterium]